VFVNVSDQEEAPWKNQPKPVAGSSAHVDTDNSPLADASAWPTPYTDNGSGVFSTWEMVDPPLAAFSSVTVRKPLPSARVVIVTADAVSEQSLLFHS
jgi:hypothetical protein